MNYREFAYQHGVNLFEYTDLPEEFKARVSAIIPDNIDDILVYRGDKNKLYFIVEIPGISGGEGSYYYEIVDIEI